MDIDELIQAFAIALVVGRASEYRHGDRPEAMTQRGQELYRVAQGLVNGFILEADISIGIEEAKTKDEIEEKALERKT